MEYRKVIPRPLRVNERESAGSLAVHPACERLAP